MPENYTWDDDNDDEGTDLVKKLRNELKAKGKELSEIKKENDTLKVQTRESNLVNILSDLGAPNASKLSRLVPHDVEANKETLAKWWDEYRDMFGVTTTKTHAGSSAEDNEKPKGQSNVDDETREAYQRMQTSEAGAGTTTVDIDAAAQAKLQNAAGQAKSFDQFAEALRAM